MTESDLATLLCQCFARGGKVLACGNGGSAAQASHLVGELVGRYRVDRAALAAVSLGADLAVLTCIGNDYGYEQVFARQVEALGTPLDVLVCLSTSGRSANVLRAADEARRKGLSVVAVTGSDPDRALGPELCRWSVQYEGDTASVQEQTLGLIHRVCGEVESRLFGGGGG